MTWSGAAGGSSAPARWGTPPRSTRWPPVCAGDRHRRATKILGLLTTSAKSYAATIRLGQTTATEDAEGEVLTSGDAGHLTDAEIAAAIAPLRGDIEQVPSTVSAIKVGGKRSYRSEERR